LASIIFDGVDLSPYIEFPRIDDLFALAALAEGPPGGELEARFPILAALGMQPVDATLHGLTKGSSRANLLSKKDSLYAALNPRKGYCYLTRTDVTDRRYIARVLGAPWPEPMLPFRADWVEGLAVKVRRLPYAEALTETVLTLASGAVVINPGPLHVFPTYSLKNVSASATTVNTELTVYNGNSQKFIYYGDIEAGETLHIDAATGIVKVDASTRTEYLSSSRFPPLRPTGEYDPEQEDNTVIFVDADFDLTVTYRRLWLA